MYTAPDRDDSSAMTSLFAKARRKKSPAFLFFTVLALFFVVAVATIISSHEPRDIAKIVSSPYALLLFIPPVLLASLIYGFVCLMIWVANQVWSLVLLPDRLVLHRTRSGQEIIRRNEIIAVEVVYAGGLHSYDNLRMDIRLRNGTLRTTGPCLVKGEAVEAAAWEIRKWLKEAGISAGSRDHDRSLRRTQVRRGLLLAILVATAATVVFVSLGCYQVYAQIQWARLQRHGVSAEARIINEPTRRRKTVDIRFVFTPRDGRPRVGSATLIQARAQTLGKGESIEIHYLDSDPDVFHPVDARVGLGAGVFVFVGIWLATAAILFIPLSRGKRLVYSRRRFHLLGISELEEERLPECRLADALE